MRRDNERGTARTFAVIGRNRYCRAGTAVSVAEPEKRSRVALPFAWKVALLGQIAALGVFVIAAAFSLREGIDELIHPSATSSFVVAYVVLAISTVLDLVSFRQSAGQMISRARRYHREFLEESRITSDPSLQAVFAEDAVSGLRPCSPCHSMMKAQVGRCFRTLGLRAVWCLRITPLWLNRSRPPPEQAELTVWDRWEPSQGRCRPGRAGRADRRRSSARRRPRPATPSGPCPR